MMADKQSKPTNAVVSSFCLTFLNLGVRLMLSIVCCVVDGDGYCLDVCVDEIYAN